MSHEISRILPARSALVAASLLLGYATVTHGGSIPGVSVTKDDGVAAATKKPGGSAVTYTNTVANPAGAPTATGVLFKDPDIANTTYVPSSLKATPVAIDDSYSATVIANSRIDTATSGFSVVANDFPGYLDGAPVAAASLTITNVGTPAHGTVTMTPSGAGVGRFVYTPTPGYTGSDSFTYTVSNTVTGGAPASITGTVNLTVGGPVIWFVNPAAAVNGDGTLHSPFNNLAAAVTAIGASTNHRVFVFSGGSAQTTGIALNAGSWLVGQGVAGTTFDALMGTTYPSDTVTARPAINQPTKPQLSRSSGGNTVTLANNAFVAGLDITNSSSAGFAVAGDATVNAATIGSASALDLTIGATGSSSGAFSLNGGNGVIAVNGTITAAAGRSVQVQNRTASTVTFSRAISGSGATATGVLLNSNTNAAIAFTGGLSLNTGGNAAFTATGGGTVTATQDNTSIVNTIATTTGNPLEVSSTTIGAAGLTFRSIAANGASNGVRLNGTGGNGLTITGTGSANSGGVLQNLTGDGIQLTNASNVSLTDMSINNVAGSWIDATTVTGLTLSRVSADLSTDHGFKASGLTNLSITGGTFDRGGANNASANFNGFDITNLLGTSTVTGSTFRRSNTIQFRVRNTAATSFGGAPDTLTVSGTNWNTHNNAFAGDHLSVDAGTGGNFRLVMNATGGLNTVNEGGTAATGGGIGVQATSSGTNGKMDVSVTGLKTTANTAGVVLGQTGSGALTYNILNNSGVNGGFNATGTCAIIVTHASSAGTSSGTISGNSITHTAGPGVNALQVVCEGVSGTGGTATTVITNNTISGNFQRGIQLQARVANSVLNATVSSNTLNGTDTTANALQVVNVETGGSGSGHANTVRLNLQSNTVTFGAGATYTAAYRLINRAACTFQLHNFAGSGSVAADVQSWVTSAKSNSGTPVAVTPTAAFTTTSSVPQPLMFMADTDAVSKPETETAAAPAVEKATPAVTTEAVDAVESTTPKPAVAAAPAIRQEELDALVAEAITRWTATGLTDAQIARLKEIKFQVSDLPGSQLGQMGGHAIEVNRNAAGHEWHVDSAPHDDHDFCNESSPTRLLGAGGDTADRVDLLTTVMHEMGHALGLPDLYQSKDRDNLMFGLLPKGERRLPAKDQAKDVAPFEENGSHFLTGGLNPISLGNLPAGKSVVITYQVQIDDPFALGATQISSQATVSGSNFPDVLSNDPNTGALADATVTLLDRPDAAVVSLDRASSNPRNSSTVTWQIVFSQPVSGLTNSHFSLVNSGLGGSPAISSVTELSGPPSTTWNITASTGSGDGSLGLNLVNDTGLSHDVTNAPFTGQVYTVDRTAPTVAFSSAAPNPTNVSPIPVTVTFNEIVTGFAAGDITPGNATVANFGGSGTTYTFDLVPAGQGSVTADIAVGVAQDAATNGNTAAAQFSRNYDSTAPTVAMTSATGNPASNAAIPVSVTFNESVTGFIAGDITPGNATVANFAGSGASYTFDLVPSGPGVTVTADIAAGVAQDAAGNLNTVAGQFSRTVLDAVSIAATTATAVEGGATGLYTFTRGTSSGDVTVNFQLDPSSTAVVGTDFTLSSSQTLTFDDSIGAGALLIPDGSLTATITLTALTESQNAAEASETARLNVTPGTGYVPASGPGSNATVTINQNGFLVVNTNDSGEGSLRQAILNANAIAGADTIVFGGVTFADASADTITLTGGELVISSSLTIDAPGANLLTISGNNASRVFSVATGGDATIRGLGVTGGNGVGAVFSGTRGGGVLNQGVIRMESCSIFDNFFGADGAGLHNSSGVMTLESCTVSGNVSTGGNNTGAGIDNSGGALVLVNSTFSGNQKPAGSGSAGALWSNGNATIRNCTFTTNAASGSTDSPGGIRSVGYLSIANTIVAGNTNLGSIANDVFGSFFSVGGNLIGEVGPATGFTNGVNSDQVGSSAAPINPLLSTLADNGGATKTHALLSGSPALNAGVAAAVSEVQTLRVSGSAGTYTLSFGGQTTAAIAYNAASGVIQTALQGLSSIGAGNVTVSGASPLYGVTFTGTLANADRAALVAVGSGGASVVVSTVREGGGIPHDQRGTGFDRAIGVTDIGSFELQKSVFITADLASANEGTGAGTTDFTFTVTRSGGTTGPVTVDYAVTGSGGNPADAADFGGTFPSGQVTIADGSATTSVTVSVSKDTTRESNEGFQVTLSNPDNGYVVSGTSATSTITNDDFEADLAITKTDGVTTAIPGGSVTYTITASNAGPDPVVGATVADTFPAALTANWTAVGAGGGTATAAGTGNINDTVNLPVGGSVTYTVTATISPSATGTLTNTATVSSTVTDPTPGNNSATDTDTLTPQADLAITKTNGVTTATPGGSVTYTITASNAGPSNATATVADIFPASLTATWTAVGAGGGTATASGSGNINDTVNLPAGGSVTYTVSATISSAATGTLTNTATVAASAGVTDPTPGNNSATDTDTLSPRADLSITKTDGVTTATPGGSVTYTITASNAGPSNATATVADTLPASLTATWTAVGAGGGTATASGSGNINDTVNLPAGGSVTYTVSATISPSATGTLSNTATVTSAVTDPTPGNNSATDSDTLTPRANLSITKTDGVTTATPGGSVTYTITATNAGPSNVTGATVADTLPASLTATWTGVGAGGGTATASGSGNINDTVNLPVGASVTYTVSATISPAASGTLSNTATVTAPAGVTDPTPADNSATDSDTLQAQADLAITKTDGVTTATPGGSVTYTITASNAGPSNVTGATVADTFPASLNTTWTAVGAGGGTATASGSGNINDTVNLPAGGSVTYTVTATISPSATGTLTNTATVAAPAGVTDPTPGNNSATDTDTLAPQADLTITKTDGATTAIPGGSVTYTITASNSGPSNAPGVTVADTLPATLTGVTWTAVGAGGGTATASGTGNINDTANLPAGGSVTYTVTATISPSATGTLSNTATVAAPAGVTDPTPGNNSATDTDTLTPQANLAITKTDGVTTAIPGGSVTYTITATNAGPSNATGATVADTLSASLTATWTAVGAGGGTATASGSGNINDTVNLPVGASVTYTVSATISASATGTLSNTATVAAPAGVTDPTPGNNSATDSDTLTPRANLSITKTDGVTTAIPGNSVTYTITATNAGPSNVTGATVADTLPASLTATWTAVGAGGGTATASGSGNINDTVNLPVGGSVTYTVSAAISASASGTLANTATVSAPAGVTDPTPADNSATDTDTLNAQADLSITKTDGVTTATPGGSVTYTITASNAGPSNATSVSVADTLPASISGATWTGVGAGGGTGPASGSGNISASTINLPAGGSFTFTVTAPISAAATGTLVNTATVSSAATDPNPANNSATDTDTLTPRSDLAITKTDGVTSAVPGTPVTYTITASNAGPSNAPGATVADTLPATLTSVTWTAVGAGGGTATASGTGNINDTVNLPSGGSVTYTVTGTISSTATGTLANTATVAAPAGVTDTNPANNSATDTDTLTPQANLAVTMTDSPDPVNALGNLTYSIGLTNNGPSASVSPQVTLPLPAGTTFVSASAPAGWTPSTPAVGATGTVTFTAASIATGGTANFTVVAKVDINIVNDSILTATTTASSATADPTPGNNTATATTTAKSGADLELTLADSPDPVNAGTNLTYTIGLANHGPLDADSVVISETLPTGTTFVSLGSPAGWVSTTPAVGSPGMVTIARSTFANAANASFTLVVKVAPNVAAGTILSGSATVGSSTVDIVPGNNSSTVTTSVSTQADLAVAIIANPTTAPKGSNVTYSVGLSNQGPSDATSPVVTLPLPANTTFVSAAAPAGWTTNAPSVGASGTVTFSATSLATGGTGDFTVVAKVNNNTPTGTVLTATATTSSTAGDSQTTNNTATATVAVGTILPTVVQPVTTGITVNPQSGLYEVNVNVTNTTPNPINGFRLHVDYNSYKAAFPSLRLYNASSPANAQDVYVDYPFPVAIDGVITMKLSFYTSTRTFPSPFAPQLTVEILPTSQLPNSIASGVQPRVVGFSNGNVLLEFPSVVGKWYRVRYSSDLINWHDSPVPLQAGSNRMQWIDSGPPFTDVPPSQAPARYYRVNEIAAP